MDGSDTAESVPACDAQKCCLTPLRTATHACAHWYAHGRARIQSDEQLAKGMKVIDQNLAYMTVGTKVCLPPTEHPRLCPTHCNCIFAHTCLWTHTHTHYSPSHPPTTARSPTCIRQLADQEGFARRQRCRECSVYVVNSAGDC